jgi:branched-subunit amino acid ABC-type transport system permease component
MDNMLLAAFTAGALGGFGSIWGAYVSGVVIGVAQDLGAAYVAPDSTQWITFVLLFVVLMLRPHGLFGRGEGRAV